MVKNILIAKMETQGLILHNRFIFLGELIERYDEQIKSNTEIYEAMKEKRDRVYMVYGKKIPGLLDEIVEFGDAITKDIKVRNKLAKEYNRIQDDIDVIVG